MCLACEMDALWFAEMEAAAGAAPGTAGVPPAFSGEPAVSAETGPVHSGPSPSPSEPAEVKRAGRTPAVPGARFRCEETRS